MGYFNVPSSSLMLMWRSFQTFIIYMFIRYFIFNLKSIHPVDPRSWEGEREVIQY